MVRKVLGWTKIIVRACLEGMGKFEEETSGLEGWLKEDVRYFLDFFIFFCSRGSSRSLFSPR